MLATLSSITKHLDSRVDAESRLAQFQGVRSLPQIPGTVYPVRLSAEQTWL